MSKTKITAPVEGYTGVGVGGLEFVDGVAHTSDESLINYFRGAGYGVGKQDIGEHPLNTSELAELRRRARNASDEDLTALSDDDLLAELAEQGISVGDVRKMLNEPYDPRNLPAGGVINTAPLRDAAVNPLPTDFLAPTNAGEANPHGSQVVAPGIHGIESQVIRPGQVYVDDLVAQDAAETEQAQKLLVEGQDVGDAVATFTAPSHDEDGELVEDGSDTGPLDLSDPGSVVAIETGNAADAEPETTPGGAEAVEAPAGNASLEEWQAYAKASGATDADLEGKGRNDLRDQYSPAS